MSERPPHMSPEEFRRAGYAVVDWLAQYMSEIEGYPVLSQVEPGEIRAKLPAQPPAHGEPWDRILADVDRVVMPGITHWQSPSFFAYFPANASAPAILGDLLSSGLGVQGMLWATSPACTEVETHVLDWLVSMLDLPDRFLSTGAGGGVIQDSASSASLCAMLAARECATEQASKRTGLRNPLVAYTSSQAHSSLEKAAKIIGLGSDNLRAIDVDDTYAMRANQLAESIEADRAAGRLPFFVSATVGTTSSTAIDPVPAIAEITQRHGLWLHVDAAHSGSAALLPQQRWIHAGVEHAHSYTFNPHKWMLTNFDCSAFYVAERKALVNALTVLPEYLKNQATASGAVFDYRDWHIPLGRRFRALKLWFVIRHYGVEGLRAHVRHHLELAAQFRRWVEEDPDFELAAPVPLSLVCFRHRGGDEVNRQLLERLNGSGALYLSHTVLGDRYILRMAIGSPTSELRHIEAAWQEIRRVAGELMA